jgi:hypothetical protein
VAPVALNWTSRAMSAVVLPNVWRISCGRSQRTRHSDLQLPVTKPTSIRSLIDRQLHARGRASAVVTSVSGAACGQRTFHREPAATGRAGEGEGGSRATPVFNALPPSWCVTSESLRLLVQAKARNGSLTTMQVHGGGRRTWRGTRGAGGPRVPNGLPTESGTPVPTDAQKPALAGRP